jgi:hypothetical protein
VIGKSRRFERTRPVASRPALFAAALAAFVLTGCGVSSDPEQTVVSAARTTLSQGLLSSFTLSDAGALGAPHAPVGAKGASVFATGLGYAAIDLSTVAHAQPGIEYLVLLPSTVYVMPIAARAAGLPQGKTWVSVPLAGTGRVYLAFPRLAEQLEGLNAELLLDEIAWGTAQASHVGEPVIDHVPLSEYVVTVNLSRAAAAAVGASAAAMRSAIGEELVALRTSRPGAGSVRIRVWVDGPGQIARLEAVLPGSGLGTISLVLSQFGAKIGRSLPLASQVVGLASLVRPGEKLPVSPLAFGLR